jgi:phosphotransferase system enzyme I (PtsP)
VPRPSRAPSIHVHHKGERGVDGILRLIELAGQDGPVEGVLTAMCAELSAIAEVDVASVYVREGGGKRSAPTGGGGHAARDSDRPGGPAGEAGGAEDEASRGDDDDALVMRGNHGFPPEAIGTVVLRFGEGITGMVAEVMRPVSAANAAAHTGYKHVDGLGEERFPAFAGVPLISGGRTSRTFTPAEVALAMALGAPVTLALERRRAAAVRSARLVGTSLVPGLVLGRAGIVPTSTALGTAPGDLTRASHRLRDDVERACRRLRDATDPAVGAALDRMTLALIDQRLRERLAAAATRPAGLREVARDYARAPYRVGTEPGAGVDPAITVRVAEIEELCVLLGTAADSASALRPGAVWIGDRIGACVALAAVGRGAAALVAAGAEVSPAAIAIARAARLPLVAEAHGIFGWARAGDLLAVDADRGEVLVNPAPADIERVRRLRTAQADDEPTLPGH